MLCGLPGFGRHDSTASFFMHEIVIVCVHMCVSALSLAGSAQTGCPLGDMHSFASAACLLLLWTDNMVPSPADRLCAV